MVIFSANAELKTSASKSWLGGWFKREASPVPNGPGPIKAKLGDPSSMVFDAELKKWVVKVRTRVMCLFYALS
jgi:hypothetical protein